MGKLALKLEASEWMEVLVCTGGGGRKEWWQDRVVSRIFGLGEKILKGMVGGGL